MKPSKLFFEITKRKFLYNITLIDNIDSIINKGILSYEMVKNINHLSIASEDVQKRRENVEIPGGMKLHNYANLYFDFKNPMLYKRKEENDNICIIAVSADVLNIEGCIITDRNAATKFVLFYSPNEGLSQLEFDKIYAKYWTHGDYYEHINHKAIKCAEVLVPNLVPLNYIESVCVNSENAKTKLISKGYNGEIIVNPESFY